MGNKRGASYAALRCTPVIGLLLAGLLLLSLTSFWEVIEQPGRLLQLPSFSSSSSSPAAPSPPLLLPASLLFSSCSDIRVSAAYANEVRISHCQRPSGRSGAFVIAHRKPANGLLPSTSASSLASSSSSTSSCASRAAKWIPGAKSNTHQQQPLEEAAAATARHPHKEECGLPSRPIYRVRITGPEIFYARIVDGRRQRGTESGDDNDASGVLLLLGEYELMFASDARGYYHAEIMQLYANFTYCDLPRLNDDLFVASHRWQIGGGRGGGGGGEDDEEEEEEVAATTPPPSPVPAAPACNQSTTTITDVRMCSPGNGNPGSGSTTTATTTTTTTTTTLGHHTINNNGAAAANPGRWLADVTSSPAMARLVQELNQTRVFELAATSAVQPTGPESYLTMQKARPSHQLRWQPASGCSIDPSCPAIAKAWRRACAGRDSINNHDSKNNDNHHLVCFAGDSQMRHLYATANAILNNIPIPADRNRTYKYVPASAWSRYVYMVFGDELDEAFETPKESHRKAAVPADLGNCSRVALNIGQWPLGWTAGTRPWTLRAFQARVDTMMRTIERRWPHLWRGRRDGSIAWVSTHPHGLLRERMGNATHTSREWRTDPYIQRQNAAARRYFAKLGIRYVDTYAILHPLEDLSYDGAHYIGSPGYWASALLLNSVCRE